MGEFFTVLQSLHLIMCSRHHQVSFTPCVTSKEGLLRGRSPWRAAARLPAPQWLHLVLCTLVTHSGDGDQRLFSLPRGGTAPGLQCPLQDRHPQWMSGLYQPGTGRPRGVDMAGPQAQGGDSSVQAPELLLTSLSDSTQVPTNPHSSSTPKPQHRALHGVGSQTSTAVLLLTGALM